MEMDKSKMDVLKALYDFFPTAVYTGKCLVFISEDWKVELREHKNRSFGLTESESPVIRVKILKKALNGEFISGHYEDFQLRSISELAGQIERYVQFAVGQNIRENI